MTPKQRKYLDTRLMYSGESVEEAIARVDAKRKKLAAKKLSDDKGKQ